MELDENDVVVTLWGASLPTALMPPGFEAGDWLCLLVKRAAGGLEGEYRFRYHAGPGFDCDDKVTRWRVSIKEDTPQARATFTAAIRALIGTGGFENVTETAVNGGADALKAAMLELPGWSVRMRTEERT